MRIWIRRIVFTITTLLLMSMSFGFSGQSAPSSGKLSKGIIARTVEINVFDRISYHTKAELVRGGDHFVRKAAHFTEYALLGASLYLLFSAWFLTSKKKPYILAMLIALLYATSDEIHQIFSLMRGPQVTDVLIDFSGCLAALTVIWFINALISKIRLKQSLSQ